MTQRRLGKTVAIIQARLGSTRLPLKSLLCLHGSPLIDWVVERLQQATKLDQIIVATPDSALDAVLRAHLAARGVAVFSGSEDDVLARFCDAARQTQADTIVRVCADNPLIWGEAVDQLITFYEQHDVDYAYNHIPRENHWPDGLGAEILAAKTLFALERSATTKAQREHCLNYIWDNPQLFSIATFDPDNPVLCRPDLKLDVDTVEDFVRLALAPLNKAMGGQKIIHIMDSMAKEAIPLL